MIYMEENKKISLDNKKIWVAGHNGMVGKSIVRLLKKKKCKIIFSERKKVDLTNQLQVENWMKINKPEIIFLAAAKVGGIYANNEFPVNFLEENLLIYLNIIKNAFINGTRKLINLGSSCIYPKNINYPIKEDNILSGPLEETNQWYSIAKISGIKLCQAYRKQFNCDFISIMPSNLYGPGDNFKALNSHVPAALIDRFHLAKLKNLEKVEVWGSGKPLREFLYVEDLAEASIFLAENYSKAEPINVGTGKEISIKNFAELIKKVVGFKGDIIFDKTKPDGVYKKVLNIEKINGLGWSSKTSLEVGLRKYYKWYIENFKNIRR